MSRSPIHIHIHPHNDTGLAAEDMPDYDVELDAWGYPYQGHHHDTLEEDRGER